MSTIKVISYDEYKKLNEKWMPCECCSGLGYILFHDDYGNEYDPVCENCNGKKEVMSGGTMKEYQEELQSLVDRYEGFTGTRPDVVFIED